MSKIKTLSSRNFSDLLKTNVMYKLYYTLRGDRSMRRRSSLSLFLEALGPISTTRHVATCSSLSIYLLDMADVGVLFVMLTDLVLTQNHFANLVLVKAKYN